MKTNKFNIGDLIMPLDDAVFYSQKYCQQTALVVAVDRRNTSYTVVILDKLEIWDLQFVDGNYEKVE